DLFFFSSRRRHTRLVSDWSSDVCSSDLAAMMDLADVVEALLKAGAQADSHGWLERTPLFWTNKVEIARLLLDHGAALDARDWTRSEERRVGKEGRSRRGRED